MRSRMLFFPAGSDRWPLRPRKASRALVKPSFPAGEETRSELSTIEAHQRVAQPAVAGLHDRLFGERLGIGVGVGPAPAPRPLHPQLHQLAGEPELPFAGDGQPQRATFAGVLGGALGIAPLFLEPLQSRSAKLGRQSQVLGTLAGARDDPLAVGDLQPNVERRPLQLFAAGIGAQHRLVLEDRSTPLPGHEAGGDVDQRSRQLERQRRRVLGAARVHFDAPASSEGSAKFRSPRSWITSVELGPGEASPAPQVSPCRLGLVTSPSTDGASSRGGEADSQPSPWSPAERLEKWPRWAGPAQRSAPPPKPASRARRLR